MIFQTLLQTPYCVLVPSWYNNNITFLKSSYYGFVQIYCYCKYITLLFSNSIFWIGFMTQGLFLHKSIVVAIPSKVFPKIFPFLKLFVVSNHAWKGRVLCMPQRLFYSIILEGCIERTLFCISVYYFNKLITYSWNVFTSFSCFYSTKTFGFNPILLPENAPKNKNNSNSKNFILQKLCFGYEVSPSWNTISTGLTGCNECFKYFPVKLICSRISRMWLFFNCHRHYIFEQ